MFVFFGVLLKLIYFQNLHHLFNHLSNYGPNFFMSEQRYLLILSFNCLYMKAVLLALIRSPIVTASYNIVRTSEIRLIIAFKQHLLIKVSLKGQKTAS